MSAQSSAQGTTRSISARNAARRVVLAYFSNPVLASVICLLFILIPRPCLLSAEALPFRQVNRGLVQSFPSIGRTHRDQYLCWNQLERLAERDGKDTGIRGSG